MANKPAHKANKSARRVVKHTTTSKGSKKSPSRPRVKGWERFRYKNIIRVITTKNKTM